MGIERVLLAMGDEVEKLITPAARSVAVVNLAPDDSAAPELATCKALRDAGFTVLAPWWGMSAKKQLKKAATAGVSVSVLVGGQEGLIVRDMDSGRQLVAEETKSLIAIMNELGVTNTN